MVQRKTGIPLKTMRAKKREKGEKKKFPRIRNSHILTERDRGVGKCEHKVGLKPASNEVSLSARGCLERGHLLSVVAANLCPREVSSNEAAADKVCLSKDA